MIGERLEAAKGVACSVEWSHNVKVKRVKRMGLDPPWPEELM